MKIATWNVNGIRARQAEVQDFLDRERPDVLCLQEIKASPDQLPVWLVDIEGYWGYWHGDKGYSGVALHLRQDRWPERPAFSHPPFDFERRIATVQVPGLTVASIYVPNGGKDFDAKMRFLEALDGFAREFVSREAPVVFCGDFNVTRTDMDVHPKERKPRAMGQLPEERALIERILSHGLVDVHRTLDADNAEVKGYRFAVLFSPETLFEELNAVPYYVKDGKVTGGRPLETDHGVAKFSGSGHYALSRLT